MKVVVMDWKGDWECHKADCRDAVKKMTAYGAWSSSLNHWFEDSIEEAEENYNIDLGVDAGFDEPWVWKHHVEVYPCTKEGY